MMDDSERHAWALNASSDLSCVTNLLFSSALVNSSHYVEFRMILPNWFILC